MELASEDLQAFASDDDMADAAVTPSVALIDTFWLTLAGLLPILGLLPMLLVEAVQLWARPHYRFVPFAISAGVGLIAFHFRPAPPDRTKFMLGIGAVVTACFLGVVSIVFFWPALSHLAVVLLIFGWLLGQLGETRTSRIVAIAMLFLCTVPLPFGWDVGLMRWFQLVAGSWTSGALDALGILHLREGLVIASRFFQLPITRVAGGPDSIFLLGSLAFFLVAARRHSRLAAAIMIATVPLWLISYGTICQVVLAVYGDSHADATASLPFSAVRLIVLFVIFLSMIMFDFGLVAMFRPENWETNAEDEWLEDEKTLIDMPASIPLNEQPQAKLVLMASAGSLLLAGILAISMIATHTDAALQTQHVSILQFSQIAARDALPVETQGWRLIDYDIEPVAHSGGYVVPAFVWKYANGLAQTKFVLRVGGRDGNPIEAYLRDGWRVTDKGPEREPKSTGGSNADNKSDGNIEKAFDASTLTALKNQVGEQAFLLATSIDTTGSIYMVSDSDPIESSAFTTIFTKLGQQREAEVSDAFEVQFLSVSIGNSAKINPAATALYEEFVARIRERTKAAFLHATITVR